MTLTTGLIGEIQALKAERRAAILAHNYQIPAIQDLADVVADSLQMARRATELDAPLLVICGVQFMAETAAIANPDKRVVIPDLEAGCSLAATIHAEDVRAWPAQHPDAEFLVHPECGCVTSAMYYAESDGDVAAGRTAIVSTEQMMRRARTSSAREFVVATETGVLHRLRRENPAKQFFAAAESAECRYMKMITLEKLRDSLRDVKYEVTVPEEIARRARRAIDRMLAIG